MSRPVSLAALLVFGLAATLMSACGDDGAASAAELVRSDAERAEADPAAAAGAAQAVEAFGVDLYRLLAREEGNPATVGSEQNIVFSPYSAAVALAMTRAGAAGETASQMDAVLHADLAGELDPGFNALAQALDERPGEFQQGEEAVTLELSTANSLWGQSGFDFHAEFLDRLAAQYGAGIRLVDYVKATEEARTAINQWVAGQTNDRIDELIAPGVLNDMTRLVLTNAIYLNAPWLHPFDEEATTTGAFHRLDGSEVEAQMMQLSRQLRYAEGDGYQAVELPYVGDALAMIIIVPDEGAFANFEAALDAGTLADIIGALEAGPEVQLQFPRFEFRTSTLMKKPLSELGMPVAFTDDADFSAMSPAGDDLLIQEVVHEAFISVDEHGTEAAAATAVVVGLTSAPEETVELKVDRPFLFLIRDRETGALLFMGRIVDPTS